MGAGRVMRSFHYPTTKPNTMTHVVLSNLLTQQAIIIKNPNGKLLLLEHLLDAGR